MRKAANRATDTQRQVCYTWESVFEQKMFEEGNHLGYTNVEDCIRYVQLICKIEGVAVPIIKFTTRGNCSSALGSTALKFLVADGKISNKTIIHEMAHIVDSARGRNHRVEPGHGPRWVGIYIDMLVRYGEVSKAMLEHTAYQGRVRFNYSGLRSK